MHYYPLEKYHFYIHGNRVIAVSTYAGKTVRGVAVCSPEDKFNLQRGKELAAARCNAKIAQKRVNRAHNRLIEAGAEVIKTKEHLSKMGTYYEDAVAALDNAQREIERIQREL